MQLHQKFKDRGVSFVSLTMESEETVKRFNEAHGITWRTIPGLSRETMSEFGVLNSNGGYADPSMKTNVMPTLYALDSAGKVLWHDYGYRWTHPDVPSMIGDLELLIELALLADVPQRRSGRLYFPEGQLTH